MGFPLNLLGGDAMLGARGHMIGGRTGALAALAADAIVASVRNSATSELIVSQLAMGFYTTTLSSVLSGVAFAAYKVESFTASPTDGRATEPVAVRKRSEDHSALANVEIEIANTAAMTAGTPAAPTVGDPLCFLVCNVGVTAGAVSYSGQSLWTPKGLGLSLRQNEGLLILNQSAFPTSLQGRFFLGLEAHHA